MAARRRKLGRPIDPKVKKAAAEQMQQIIGETHKRREERRESYRDMSIRIHGTFCAKCGQDFEGKDLRLLTVHHKDGNHHNNPNDGSNWENLCVYCHEDEHARGDLADYLTGARESVIPNFKDNDKKEPSEDNSQD
jgi:5-methylcytosine-specific restriction endonuclease McrA